MTGRPPFKMPIDIDFGTMLGTERFTVWDSLATQVFFLDVDAPVSIGSSGTEGSRADDRQRPAPTSCVSGRGMKQIGGGFS